MELFDKGKIRNGKNTAKKTKGTKNRVSDKLGKLRNYELKNDAIIT